MHGEVLQDELKAITEYVKDAPTIRHELHQVHATVNDINDRLIIIEHVVKDHEIVLKKLKRTVA